MSLFDMQLNVIGLEVAIPDLENEPDAAVEVQIALTTAITVPVVDPASGRTIGAMPVPAGRVRFKFEDPEQAVEFGNHLAEQAGKLPARAKESGLVTAASLSEVNQVAKSLNGFR